MSPGDLVAVRPFPYPFRAMLALSNDIDQTRAPRFRQIHRFLNTAEETPIGPGLGLDIADSFWFYGRSILSREEDASDFTYFRGLSWDDRSPYAEEIAHYLRSGWIDTIHSYGNFSGVRPEQRCTREHAVKALEALASTGVEPSVWVNHGSADNVQNIGRSDYMEGDRPDSPSYHWDLLRAAGVEYLWDGADAGQFRRASALVPLELKDGSQAWGFQRFYTLAFEEAIAHGLHPSVADQLRRQRDYAVLWHPQHLHVQLSEAHLDELSSEGGFAVLAQHLGATPRSLVLGGPATRALRRLADYQARGLILVARTSRLLDFNRARDFVKFSVSEDGDRTTVDILGVDDPIAGFSKADADQLRGITFYVPDPERVRLLIDGTPADEAAVERNPSDGHMPSIGLRWFEPDHRDHAESFPGSVQPPRRTARLAPELAVEKSQAILAENAAGPVPEGVTQDAYEYAVQYSRHRYDELPLAARLVHDLGLVGLSRALDIGSGPGQWCIAYLLFNDQVTGIDSRVEFAELGRRVAEGLGFGDRLSYVVGRAEALPFESDTFDVAWANEVLQYTNVELALAEASRVLRPGGLLYCNYPGLGFRLSAVYKALEKRAEAAATAQVQVLLGTRCYRQGLYQTPWSRIRAPSLDDAITTAFTAGLRYVDEPDLHGEAQSFLGLPAAFGLSFQKNPQPSQPAARDLDPDGLDRLIAAGSPSAAISTLQERPDVKEDPQLRRLLLRALIKAGETSGGLVESLRLLETDPIVLGTLYEQRREYEEAYEQYSAAGEAASFLAGTCLIALGRFDEAKRILSTGLGSTDREHELDCRVALCAVAAEQEGLGGLAHEFAALLDWLGASSGRDEEAEALVAGLRRSAPRPG